MAVKIIDVDRIFEKQVRSAMMSNKGKFTEDEWEDKIAGMYSQFGKAPLAEFDGKSPEAYYGSFSGEELASALKKHVTSGVDVSTYLFDALVSSGGAEDYLIAFLDDKNAELVSYSVNILAEKKSDKALKIFLERIVCDETNEGIREAMGEAVIDNAKELQNLLLAVKGKAGKGEMYVAEALARCDRKQEIFEYLTGEFMKESDNNMIAYYACLLSEYGDDRAVEFLKTKINEPELDYAAYSELKNCIEELGGECDDLRDFSGDATYKRIKNLS